MLAGPRQPRHGQSSQEPAHHLVHGLGEHERAGNWYQIRYERLIEHFSAEQIVALTAFGAMMVATNIVNNALEVELDGYLLGYRKADRGHPTAGS